MLLGRVHALVIGSSCREAALRSLAIDRRNLGQTGEARDRQEKLATDRRNSGQTGETRDRQETLPVARHAQRGCLELRQEDSRAVIVS